MAMVVACTHCGAQYEFESSAIPPEGYDAQCTNCQGLFFVRPEITVSCHNCAAAYQFSPLDIPEAGYDAQCTQCQAVFFVSRTGAKKETVPEPQASAEQGSAPTTSSWQPEPAVVAPQTQAAETGLSTPSPNPTPQPTQTTDAVDSAEVTAPQPALSPAEVSNSTVLEPLSTIPSDDPDEQVTLTNHTYDSLGLQPITPEDVEPTHVAEPIYETESKRGTDPMEVSPEELQRDAALSTQDNDTITDTPPQEPERGTAPMDMSPQELEHEATDMDDPHGLLDSDDPLLSLNAELGEPESSPVTAEQDFEALLKHRKRKRFIILGVLSLPPLVLASMYFVMPRLFDDTVGQLVGIKAPVDPAAVGLMHSGWKSMQADTDMAYAEAGGHFDAALALDPSYADALALSALGLAFRGKDIMDRGSAQRNKALTLQSEIAKLEKQKRGRAKNMRRADQLRKEFTIINQKAKTQYEQGGDYIQEGTKRLSKALRYTQTSPLVVAAAGVFEMVRDSEAKGKAKRLLKRALKLQGIKAVSPTAPADPWTPYLQALLDEANGASPVAMWRSALLSAPHFQRARYRLALSLKKSGNDAELRKIIRTILNETPQHSRAKALMSPVE